MPMMSTRLYFLIIYHTKLVKSGAGKENVEPREARINAMVCTRHAGD
jgi:hypothetical protein